MTTTFHQVTRAIARCSLYTTFPFLYVYKYRSKITGKDHPVIPVYFAQQLLLAISKFIILLMFSVTYCEICLQSNNLLIYKVRCH